ncbi:signal recognition particle subunit SRP68 [Ischnura elegans]|uniref:signal recognition particle subunit SRP68 n=1 Tax=Ischnura elegans TaxID=197161 RepID=UPI001ED89FA5|nr:signal recognition particle subunit SRP68 [Ischnura elegans]
MVEENIENDNKENEVEGESETTEEAPQQKFTFEILKIIKEAQQQHGLRHGDYQRYRGYCSRRIRRLRKVLKVTQGDKRHFKKKEITEAMVKDERFLYIPLMMAERAWAYGMQLRQEANTEPRKRFHLLSRLKKAAKYALQLQILSGGDICDARAKLEVEAYTAWINGSLHFELQLWKPAMEFLKKAQMVYEKLASALGEEDQVLYKERVEELSPSLRYCAYNIGDESAIDDLLHMRGHGQGGLLANLDMLLTQTLEKRATVLEEVEWRGRKVAVRPERVRLFLMSERELGEALAHCPAGDNAQKISLLEAHLMECKDAVQSVREELKSSDPNFKTRGQTGSGPVSSMQYFHSYLMYIRLTRTIQRNLLMADSVKEVLKTEKPEVGAIDGKRTRPQDLTRLYEIILQNLGELQSLPGLEEDFQYQQNIEAKIIAFKAFRCYYIALSLAGIRKWKESWCLYQRSQEYVEKAIVLGKKLGWEDKKQDKSAALNSFEVIGGGSLVEELRNLLSDIEGHKFAAHAYSVLAGDEDGSPGSVSSTSKSATTQKTRKPLIERLHEYVDDPALATASDSLIHLPPDFRPVPCKPLFFDLALNFVEFPELDDKLETKKQAASAGLTGFVKGLWGWGGGSSNK